MVEEIFRVGKTDQGNQFWKVNEKEKQGRITLYHRVVHALAFFMIIPYIILMTLTTIYPFLQVPIEYHTIVSVIIGFYFARSLFNNTNN